MGMERTQLHKEDQITPDRIRISSWGYDLMAFRNRSTAISFDGTEIYHGFGPCHPPIYEKHPGKQFLDFRYYPQENLLSLWVYNPDTIVPQLLEFKTAYEKMKDKPFPPTAKLVFLSKGTAVSCPLEEISTIVTIDDNSYLRQFHVLPPTEKPERSDREELYRLSERAWVANHGTMDIAEYHLLAYEE